jgi:hypothetical protein
MPVKLSVDDVRQRLLVEPDTHTGNGDRAGSIAELAALFHTLIAQFFSPGSPVFLPVILEDVDASPTSWKAALVDAAYMEVVAARLERDRATLTHCPKDVATFWVAVENLCEWLAGVLLAVYRKHGSLRAAQDLVDCERLLEFEIEEPGWADSVVVQGPADAVLRIPGAAYWCVVVLKTGGPTSEADLTLAALYKLLLSRKTTGGEDIRVVSFSPDREERLLSADELEAATTKLKTAVGHMAGVDKTAAVTPAPPADNWKQPTERHRRMQADLMRVLDNYGVAATIDGPPLLGPTVIRFLVKPSSNAKVSTFTGLVDEIAMGMNLRSVPIIERFGGRIAIDIERPDRHAVRFDELRGVLPKTDPLHGNSKVLVGVDIEGTPVFIDLAKPENCHVLVVGTAGSGKSIWLRAAIASLVETNTPDTLQLVLIDPKRNAFTSWRNSPFLREPIVFPDESPVTEVLNGLIGEMEARYQRMAELEVDDLRGLIQKEHHCVPRIVCICDEYADLVGHSDQRKEIEAGIARLGAKARAAGIHLMLATQTPRREILGGTIKANLPTCVGLRVSSAAEARVIETPGAELLLGNGDLLLKSIGEPIRLQGALLPAGSESPQLVAAG